MMTKTMRRMMTKTMNYNEDHDEYEVGNEDDDRNDEYI